MARTPSAMIPLGTAAFPFRLMDVVSGETLDFPGTRRPAATVVMFICNHCPFVKHVNSELVRLGNEYQGKDVQFFAISSNDADEYPEDGPEEMRKTARELHYPFPYLYDETQKIAEKYSAKCTPDFFIFDRDLLLVYRGQLDDSRPGNGIPLTGQDIRTALEALLENQTVSTLQKPSIGCNIKWKNRPS